MAIAAPLAYAHQQHLNPRPNAHFFGSSITNDVRGSNTIPTGVLSRTRGELETSVNSTTHLNRLKPRRRWASEASIRRRQRGGAV